MSLQLGHNFSDVELNRWLFLFDSPNCKVIQKEDGGYYLTACRFEKLRNLDEVKESANKLITMMTAIAKIEIDMDFLSIEDDNDDNLVSSIHENKGDATDVTVFPKAGKGYSFALIPKVKIFDEQGNEVVLPRQARWYDRILDQCDGSIYNTPMFEALSYFAQKTEARTVRLTYEKIRNDEGHGDASAGDKALVSNRWVSAIELKRFICSVNRKGIDSPELHAEVAADPICNMNIDEARTFCAQRLLKPWLIKNS